LVSQHPVLPEPVHLDLVVEDEKVVEARPSIGFIHRGLEKLVEKKRLSGIHLHRGAEFAAFAASSMARPIVRRWETIMNLPVSPAGRIIMRPIWGEFSRLHSHLLWLWIDGRRAGF
jgi:ech hydrogenase subunit E